MYLLYSALLAAGLLVSLPYWMFGRRRQGKYREGLSERLGRVPSRLQTQAGPVIWVHAVSVGEVLAVSQLVAELRRRFPRDRVVISTTTATGQKLAKKHFGEENVFYFPARLRFCDSTIFVGTSAKIDRPRGNRVLAQLFTIGARERGAGRGGKCAHFGSLMAGVSTDAAYFGRSPSQHRPVSGTDRGGCPPSSRYWRPYRAHPGEREFEV